MIIYFFIYLMSFVVCDIFYLVVDVNYYFFMMFLQFLFIFLVLTYGLFLWSWCIRDLIFIIIPFNHVVSTLLMGIIFFLVLQVLSNWTIFIIHNIKFEMHYDISCTFVHILMHYIFFVLCICISDPYSFSLLYQSFKVNYAYHSYFYSLYIVG